MPGEGEGYYRSMSGIDWKKSVQRASAVLAMCLLGGGILTFLVAGPRSGVAQSLAGAWPATIEFKGSTTERMLPFPVRFKKEGISPHAKVTWSIPVVLDGTSDTTGSCWSAPFLPRSLSGME